MNTCIKISHLIHLDGIGRGRSNGIVLAGTLRFNLLHGPFKMSFQIVAFGHQIEVASRLPNAFYIFTNNHEFAWSREEWFEWPSGKWRRWVIEKRT